ncbi:MAG: molybdenum ABC transporter ATP-binding protein [Beijerinckiaceae bacterium]|jgi:molybdate transport system ATP-binding protein|nr:molybdenum ABC transporter ATP-binding protein [Beijerinckiaceae bacterium]
MIEIDIRHRVGALEMRVAFRSEGPVTALFGASGAGKTTLLNLIAGLATPDSGRIAVVGETLVDREKNINLPSRKRRIGYVFQDARLFPHLTVRQNLLFGRWLARLPLADAEVERILALLDLAPLLKRRPAHLSGGEKQRVALGRALLASPRLLLMDEPLASLDGDRKDDILTHLEAVRDTIGIPIIYVSHARDEVERLASHIAMIGKGELTAFGHVNDVLRKSSGQEH